MLDEKLASACGLYCPSCEYFEKSCDGCGYVEGKPFWTSQFKLHACPIYDCCINQKQLEHCGLCDQLPCKIFVELKDPAVSDEEFQQSLIERQKVLLTRKEKGTKNWLQDKE